MHTLACRVLIGSLVLAAAHQSPEPSLAEELEALVAKTNALHSFHLVLRGEESSLELAYQVPWSARMTLSTPNDGMDRRLDEQRVYILEEDWLACELPRSKAQAALDELFPPDRALGPGVVFELGDTLASLCPLFDLSGRDALFGWLTDMQGDLPHVTRSDEALVWSKGNLELHLSRMTGLPERVVITTDEQQLELVLLESSTDSEVAGFVAPPEDWEPAEDDNALAREFALESDAWSVRQLGFQRVDEQLTAKKRTWDARTRADWESFVAALHGERIQQHCQARDTEVRQDIDSAVEWVRTELARDGTPERRDFFVKQLEAREKQWLEALPQLYLAELPKPDTAAVPRDELFDVERAVIERLHEELGSAPTLAYLHEQIEAVLGK